MKLLAFPFVTYAGLAVVGASPETDCGSPTEWNGQMAPPLTKESCNGPDGRIEPPHNSIVVDGTGTRPTTFKTIAEGIANLSNTTDEHTLFIYPGIYNEQVLVPNLAGPLVIQGYTCNTNSYASNQVTITFDKAADDLPPEVENNRNLMSSTLGFKSGTGVKVYNVNIENTASATEDHGRAGAVYVDDSDYGFYSCQIKSARGALTANKGLQLYVGTFIEGAENLISGKYAMAWFQSCQIQTTGKGWITANGNNQSEVQSEFVITDSAVYSVNGSVGITYLGQPWGLYARAVFQNSWLDSVVNPKGWKTYKNQSTDNVYFKEFNNTGAGAATDKRVAFSGQLDAAKVITDILGNDFDKKFFVDTAFL